MAKNPKPSAEQKERKQTVKLAIVLNEDEIGKMTFQTKKDGNEIIVKVDDERFQEILLDAIECKNRIDDGLRKWVLEELAEGRGANKK